MRAPADAAARRRFARWAVAALAVPVLVAARPARADSVNILFVGNSFTHGRYEPARSYNAGYGSGDVHDLLCPSPATCTAAQTGTQIDPSANPPPGTLPQQLTYLQNNPSAQYNEPGPRGGVAGIFQQFTKEAGLNYNVSLMSVSSATLTGYFNNTGNEAGDRPSIENAQWDKVVLQDQSFQPLPSTITVNGNSVATRGNPASFQKGANGLINGVDAADQAAGRPNAAVTLYETQPLAAYGYTSNNPNAPIFGSSTGPAGSIYAPYVGDPDPIAAMAQDLHNAYTGEATAYNTGNPTKSHVGVALAGDAWVSAIRLGAAVQDPFLANNPPNQIDLWDSDPLDACCTTPIGYHPSTYGTYLDALVLFDEITGIDPTTLDVEFDPGNPDFAMSAASNLDIAPDIAQALAVAAADTVAADGPVAAPEPSSLALLCVGLAGIGLIRRRPVHAPQRPA